MIGTGTTKKESPLSPYAKGVLDRLERDTLTVEEGLYMARWSDGTAVQTNTLEMLRRRGLVEPVGAEIRRTT